MSPKYVYGQKKYGRRSRPENSGEDSGSSESLFNGDINLLQNNSVNKMVRFYVIIVDLFSFTYFVSTWWLVLRNWFYIIFDIF